MKKVAFISDFFSDDILGGAELNDAVLINKLEEKGVEVTKLRTSSITDEQIIQNDVFIVSNFVNLSERYKNMLMLKKYIIYEHDHKYIKTRNPSVFSDFKIPGDQIINKEFYTNAFKVVVLSEVCKEIIQDNLNLTNVVSIGCSLWSSSKLDYIRSISETPKTGKLCIINSNNPIKGTRESIEYCNSKALNYELVGPLPEKELLKKMAEYECFMFLPHVLETLSRVVVEAKMLNCNVMTKKNLIGAASEEWFSLSGEQLITRIEQKVSEAVELFYDLLDDNTITVILNCYRRPENLKEQIDSIRSQSVPVDQVWIWVNYHEDNNDIDFSLFNVDRVIKNNYNWKFYGRFAGAMLSDTKYVALFDDDTIPGEHWLQNCLDTMKEKEGILGGAGVILSGDKYVGHKRYGWSSQNEKIVEVDLVGHAWFFKRDWLKYLWMEQPFTWHNGEDIQFSYCAQKYGNIKTYCPPHPKDNPKMFSSLKGYELGVDEKATSRTRNHNVFYAQRDACVKNAIINGWKIIRGKINEH